MGLYYRNCMLSHTGLKRKANEDNFLYEGLYRRPLQHNKTALLTAAGPLDGLHTAAIFDGMGGENDGEKASLCAAETLAAYLPSLEESMLAEQNVWDASLARLANEISHEVLRLAQKNASGTSGTTMTMLSWHGDRAVTTNVGDSPAWLYRDKKLFKLFQEHVRVSRPTKKGHTPKGGLTQFLGVALEDFVLTPFVQEFHLRAGDRLLLCSDGLGDMVSYGEIVDILRTETDRESCIQKLLAAALEHGGRDNVTIYLMDITEEAPAAAESFGFRVLDGEKQEVSDYLYRPAKHLVLPAVPVTVLEEPFEEDQTLTDVPAEWRRVSLPEQPVFAAAMTGGDHEVAATTAAVTAPMPVVQKETFTAAPPPVPASRPGGKKKAIWILIALAALGVGTVMAFLLFGGPGGKNTTHTKPSAREFVPVEAEPGDSRVHPTQPSFQRPSDMELPSAPEEEESSAPPATASVTQSAATSQTAAPSESEKNEPQPGVPVNPDPGYEPEDPPLPPPPSPPTHTRPTWTSPTTTRTKPSQPTKTSVPTRPTETEKPTTTTTTPTTTRQNPDPGSGDPQPPPGGFGN